MFHDDVIALVTQPHKSQYEMLWLDAGEGAEEAITRFVSDRLGDLGREIEEFETALILVAFAKMLKTEVKSFRSDFDKYSFARSAATNWRAFGARQAVFTVYHIRSVINSIIGNVGKTPNWATKVDTKRLQNARDTFEDMFPATKMLRDAVGHASDMRFDEEQIWKHAADTTSVSDVLVGDEYWFDKNGVRHKLALNDETIGKLCLIREEIYACFSGVLMRRSGP